ncbi:MAG: response regulator [Ignavibacteriales bacterium]|nr:response regulator [Ignavibacteriales bacterium]
MFKSKLYWKVFANFALLLIILTAMTMLTLNILSQIQKNYTLALSDTKALASLERVRSFLNDVPSAATEYTFTGSKNAKVTYENGWKEFDLALSVLQKDLVDSMSIKTLSQVKGNYLMWLQNVGDKMVLLRDRELSGKEFESQLRDLVALESQIQYMANARSLLREIYQRRIALQPQAIERASGMSSELGVFIGFINILLALFAVALGVVLTRSITKPVRLLKEGTQHIMEGKFDVISLNRTDELGELATAFNQMSTMLGNNYTKLRAYSELVTTLNSLESIHEVESRSLELLCKNLHASVGALYLLNNEIAQLELVAGYGLKRNGELVKTVRFGEGIPGQCAKEQRILEVNEIPATSDFMIDTGLVEVAPRSIIAVPIIFQDKVLGVLVLGSTTSFVEAEMDIINNSVPQLGVAITNALNDEATRKLSMEIAKRNEELNSKNAELENAYRVKSDFLSSMSHELRTPLNSIIGFSSILLAPNSPEPLTKDQKMAIEKVLKNGRHLLQLINDILDLSKLEAGRMSLSIESDDIPSVISNCVLTVEPLMKSKNLNLVQDIAPDLPRLSTDIVKIRQIIVNLLSNATKFTEKGDVTVRAWQTGEMVSMSVKDSGIGIEKKNFDLIFQEFQQIDSSNTRKYKGTGLGLPIARRLARMLGGDLTVDSEYGKGSTFTLTIPPVVSEKKAPEEKKETPKPAPVPVSQFVPPVAAAGSTKGVQILCIDDDPDVIEILRKYLVPEGYSVAGALSGDEGLVAASRLKPALITLDIMMPKKDGWQVLRELKANAATRDIPVVMHSIVDNKPLAMSLGAVDLLAKPTDPNRLLTLVKQFVKSTDQYILVVDDNEDFALAVKNLMKHDGLTIKVANGGKKALEILKESKPALILLDLLMPDMDGFEVVRQLQANEAWKRIPVIILSGKELSPDELSKLNNQVTDYMKKDDLSQVELTRTVKRILNLN